MSEIIHINDEGTVIYIDVHDEGVSLSETLSDFTTRTINIQRPVTETPIVITNVTVEEDSDDEISKLKLVTGDNVGVALTATGLFKVPSSDPGVWIAEIILADSSGSWTSAPFELFRCQRSLV